MLHVPCQYADAGHGTSSLTFGRQSDYNATIPLLILRLHTS